MTYFLFTSVTLLYLKIAYLYNFKQLFFLKPLRQLLSNFTWSMIRLQSFRITNLGKVKNPRWPPLLKIAKPSKLTFSPEPLDIIGYKFDWNINGTLVFKIMKIRKKHSRVRSQWPTLCLQVQFCSDANISRKRECILFRFDHNGP